MLDIINKATGLTKADEILEFCRVPRKSKEIYAFLGMTTNAYLMRTYIKPLVANGRLKLTIPNYASNIQRYVNAESVLLIPTDEAILDFCKEPRTKKEIAQYFEMTYFVARKHYDPLIASGKLIGDMPHAPKSNWQKFVAADIGFVQSRDETVMQFCQTPKSRKEIAEHFGIYASLMRDNIGFSYATKSSMRGFSRGKKKRRPLYTT